MEGRNNHQVNKHKQCTSRNRVNMVITCLQTKLWGLGISTSFLCLLKGSLLSRAAAELVAWPGDFPLYCPSLLLVLSWAIPFH